MRDPYHAARVRFKVARDRFIEATLREHKQLLMKNPGADLFGPPTRVEEWQRYYQHTMYVPYCSHPALADEYVEACCILHTMERFKITDERQALMLWKLSQD